MLLDDKVLIENQHRKKYNAIETENIYTRALGYAEKGNLVEAKKWFQAALDRGYSAAEIQLKETIDKIENRETQICTNPLNGAKDTGNEGKDSSMAHDLKKITEVFQKLSIEEQKELMSIIEAFDIVSKIESNKPDISHIPKWQGKKKDGLALDWLNTHYGAFIKNPNDGLCYIFRQDILRHDNKLADAISREANALGKEGKEFLPTSSYIVKLKANALPERLIRLVNAAQIKIYRDNKISEP